MTSEKCIGIEDARKTLGDLVTQVQQGTDIILTRNGKPAARIVAYKEPEMTSYTETYRLGDSLAIADLAMTNDMDALLNATLDDHEDRADIQVEIEDAITAQLHEHGVSADGEWLGQWSAEQIVRDILGRHGVDIPQR